MQLEVCKEIIETISISTKVVDDRHIKQTVRFKFKSGRVFNKTEVRPINSFSWYENLNIGDTVKAYYGYNHINKILPIA